MYIFKYWLTPWYSREYLYFIISICQITNVTRLISNLTEISMVGKLSRHASFKYFSMIIELLLSLAEIRRYTLWSFRFEAKSQLLLGWGSCCCLLPTAATFTPSLLDFHFSMNPFSTLRNWCDAMRFARFARPPAENRFRRWFWCDGKAFRGDWKTE